MIYKLKESIAITKNYYPGVIPRSLSERRLSSSNTVNRIIDIKTNTLATARMVGDICFLIPENICLGIVLCSTSAINITATISSSEVINANSAPDIIPGIISGMITLLKVIQPWAPRLCEALIRLVSKPLSVAVTVIITKGIPRVTWAKITPVYVLARFILE